MSSVRFWLIALSLIVLCWSISAQLHKELAGDEIDDGPAPPKPNVEEAEDTEAPASGGFSGRGSRGRGRWRVVRGRGRGRGRGGVRGRWVRPSAVRLLQEEQEDQGNEEQTQLKSGSSCSSVSFSSPTGTLSSPGYLTNSYYNNLNCSWTLYGGNKNVRLEITDLDIEYEPNCKWDYIEFWGPRGRFSRRCGRWPANILSQIQHVIESPTFLKIIMHSDATVSKRGFNLRWNLVEATDYPGCSNSPQIVDANTNPKTIQSPRFPQPYIPFSRCRYLIQVEENQRVTVTLERNTFNIEKSGGCVYDYLQIHDGGEIGDPLVGGSKLCGVGNVDNDFSPSGFPGTFTSRSNRVLVIFHSDGSVNRNGWRIQYTVVQLEPPAPVPDDEDKDPDACSGTTALEMTDVSGVFTSPGFGAGTYPRKKDCGWLFTVPQNQIVAFEFVQFNLEPDRDCNYDYLICYDGSTVNDNVLCKVCGNEMPGDFRSTKNSVLCLFHSDYSVERPGFQITYAAKDPITVVGECGRSEVIQKMSKIVGGQEAVPCSWPWQVALQTRYSPTSSSYRLICGASIISPTCIVTAAHCVDEEGETTSASLLRIMAGDHNIYDNDDTHHEAPRTVETVFKHPQYNPTTTENDIAVLKLKQPLQYGPCIQPVCLPRQDAPEQRNCATTGWGATSATGSANAPAGSATDNSNLLQVYLPVWPRSDCLNTRVGRSLKPFMFCAGQSQGGKDTCQGDSGGPLVCKDTDTYSLYGITSWGYGCAERDSPGVYTQVNRYRSWILSHCPDHHSLVRNKRDASRQRQRSEAVVVEEDADAIVEIVEPGN